MTTGTETPNPPGGKPESEPSPGAAPQPPGDGSSTPPPPVQEPPKPKDDEALSALKRLQSERMRFRHEVGREREELAKEKEGLQSKLAKLEELEKRDELFRRSPATALQKLWGDDWRNILAEVATNGDSTQLTKLDVEERVKSVEQKWEERFKKEEERREQEKQQRAMEAKRAREERNIAYIESNKEKYPLVHHFGTQASINTVVEAHFHETMKQDADGNWLPGELLSPEQAAEKMERFLREKVDARLAESKKTQDTQNTSSSGTPPSGATPGTTKRPSLSTDLHATGTAPKSPPPAAMSDSERMKRALATWTRLDAELKARAS